MKVFVDKRTQNKVLLVSGGGGKGPAALPAEVREFIDPAQIPSCCGGSNEEPIVDLLAELSEE